MRRCFDCFCEAADWFHVLKRMRDFPPDTDPIDAKILDSLCFDAVLVCGDCAWWYGDDAVPLTDGERSE